MFLDPSALTFWDPDHSEEEGREITIRRSGRQRVLFVAHTARESRVRIITALADVRNKAAHGKWSEFTLDDVKEMVQAIRRLMEEHFA